MGFKISGLNSKTQNKRMDWNQDPAFCCTEETHHNIKDRYYLREKGWRKVFQESDPRPIDVVILLSDKINFKPKQLREDREQQYILMKEKIHQDGIAVLNMYELTKHKGIQGHKRNTAMLKSHIDPQCVTSELPSPEQRGHPHKN